MSERPGDDGADRPGDRSDGSDGPPTWNRPSDSGSGRSGSAGASGSLLASVTASTFLRDPRVVIARRDVASLSREKTIVLALFIQLFVAAFSSFLVVGLTSLYDPGSVSAGEIVVGVSGDHADALVEAARDQEGIRAVDYESNEQARANYADGQVHAALLTTDSEGRITVEVIAPEENIRTTVIVTEVRDLLEAVERNERIARADDLDRQTVPVPAEVDASPYFGFTYTVLVPLLLFLPPFISGSIAVDAFTEELERGTLELLRVAPVTLVDIVDGKAMGMVAIAPIQAALWIALLGVNGIQVANPVPLLVLVTAFATVVVVLGLLLGLLAGRRRQAQLLYSVVVLLVFGTLVFLPEHPATTVAKLAVDSPTTVTYLHVAGYAAAAAGAYVLARAVTRRTDPEGL
ncbi:ABC transporter permease [Halobacteriales archaeon QH_3_68_24]|nr:MAG: ABC transporter permease [Halobacteriales archaeon QH_3_68_24]